MGFRNGAWATCWAVEPKSDTMTTVRLSTSRKERESGEYIQDFSGFVAFVGTKAAKKAANLKVRDRIKLESVEVVTRYVKEQDKSYTNFMCYDFEVKGDDNSDSPNGGQPSVDEPEFSDIIDDDEQDRLPF